MPSSGCTSHAGGRGGGAKGGGKAPLTPAEKEQRASTPCRFGVDCFKLNKQTHPNGCDWFHPQAHYDNYKPPSDGGGGGPTKPAAKGKAKDKAGGGVKLASGARAADSRSAADARRGRIAGRRAPPRDALGRHRRRRDHRQRRLEREQPLSFLEFNYAILQA